MSSSSSESSSVSAPTRKRKRAEIESSDSSDSSSDESEDAPQPLPPAQRTVLSHAERRRQKKKQKQLDDTSASPRSGHIKIKTVADDPRRRKRQNSVWVGNLAFRTTEDALRAFFDGIGTITRVHMPMRRGNKTEGENMGFAYVDFETPDGKVIAITRSEGQLDGRNLLIKDGNDFTGRPAKVKLDTFEVGDGGEEGDKPANEGATPNGKGLSKTAQKILRAQTQLPAPTLFLGNLGFETTEVSIRELFEAHRYRGRKGQEMEKERATEGHETDVGESKDGTAKKDMWIRKIRMGTFEDSGNCKGFAFVDFTSIEHATAALVNPRNHRLNGRDLVVEYASPDAVRRGGGPRNLKGDQDRKSRHEHTKTPEKGSANMRYTKQRRPRYSEQEDAIIDYAAEAEATPMSRSRRPDRAGHDRSHMRRAKPGAALAHAQRQSAAIVPSQGQKIVF